MCSEVGLTTMLSHPVQSPSYRSTHSSNLTTSVKQITHQATPVSRSRTYALCSSTPLYVPC
jgi:hypothetical protein